MSGSAPRARKAGYLDQKLGLRWLSLAIFVAVGALVVSSYVPASLRGDTGIAVLAHTLVKSALAAVLV